MDYEETNPLNPGALQFKDIQPGVRVARFNYRHSEPEQVATILSEPYESNSGKTLYSQPAWRVMVLTEDGEESEWMLSDMGVTPCDSEGEFWNEDNYTMRFAD